MARNSKFLKINLGQLKSNTIFRKVKNRLGPKFQFLKIVPCFSPKGRKGAKWNDLKKNGQSQGSQKNIK
jgi:hypothetical protein